MHLSIAFFLGFADIIAWGTHDNPRFSYQCVFWFEVALATVALIIMFIFVRVERAKSDLTADEKENMLNQERARSTGIPVRGHQQK